MTTELRRGDVVFYGERGEYSGKLRPGVVVQRNSSLAEAPSVTICGITTTSMPTHISRVSIAASRDNGLEHSSYVMVDKIASISRGRIRQKFGQLAEDEMTSVDRALRLWLEI